MPPSLRMVRVFVEGVFDTNLTTIIIIILLRQYCILTYSHIPTLVIWENLEVSWRERWIRYVASLSLSLSLSII